jgi:hypothetical protein
LSDLGAAVLGHVFLWLIPGLAAVLFVLVH